MANTIAVDCMGGDHGPQVTVPAALEFASSFPKTRVMLVGLSEAIEDQLQNSGRPIPSQVSIHHAPDDFVTDSWLCDADQSY